MRFRVVIAPDCRPTTGELRTDIKDTLKDALLTSSLETWASGEVGEDPSISIHQLAAFRP